MYPIIRSSNIIPSILVIFQLSNINPTTSKVTIKRNGMSLSSTFSPSFNSLSRAQIPIIPKILKTLLPTILLTASALLP